MGTPAAFFACQPTPATFSMKSPTASITKPCGKIALSTPQASNKFNSCDSDVKLVVFDFDCTLSAFHVFVSLAGIESSICKLHVPPPHARTERGQLQRLAELDADPDWGPGVFAFSAFGGPERVVELRNALVDMADNGIECIVCSRGMVGPIRKCLDQLNLLNLFSHTFGNLGSILGPSDYDLKVASIANATMSQDHYLGSVDMDVQGAGCLSKSERIANYIKSRGLDNSQAIFLDDDVHELKNSPIPTFHVAGGRGLCDMDLQLLLGLVNRPCDKSATPPTPATGGFTNDSPIGSACESVIREHLRRLPPTISL